MICLEISFVTSLSALMLLWLLLLLLLQAAPSAPHKQVMGTCQTSVRRAMQVLEALQRGAAHESLVCCAAYLLGEYGRQVQQVPLRDQFTLLQERFVTVSSEAKVTGLCTCCIKQTATCSCWIVRGPGVGSFT